MALDRFVFMKELSVSHESYHSDDYSTELFVFFIPPAGGADMIFLLCFQFSALEFSFFNFNQPVHTIVIRGMLIFLKTLNLLHIAGLTGLSLGSTVNTSTFTHCNILLCNNSVCHIYSLRVEEFMSVLLHLQTDLNVVNCFIQQQIIRSLMMGL
jgi:hypothetical protein